MTVPDLGWDVIETWYGHLYNVRLNKVGHKEESLACLENYITDYLLSLHFCKRGIP